MVQGNKICALSVQINGGTPIIAGAADAAVLTAGISVLGTFRNEKRARIAEDNFSIVLNVGGAADRASDDCEHSTSLLFAASTINLGDLITIQFLMAEPHHISPQIALPKYEDVYPHRGRPAVRIIDGSANTTICGSPELTGIMADVQLVGDLGAMTKPRHKCWRSICAVGMSPSDEMKYWAEADIFMNQTVSFEVVNLDHEEYSEPSRIHKKKSAAR